MNTIESQVLTCWVYTGVDYAPIFFLLLKHIYEFQDITGTGTSVWLSLGFQFIQLTVPMAYECNWKKNILTWYMHGFRLLASRFFNTWSQNAIFVDEGNIGRLSHSFFNDQQCMLVLSLSYS